MNEFVIEWVRGRDWAGVTAPSGSWLKTRVMKLRERYPDEVYVLAENADGSIFAHVPVKYIKISPPRKVSEEQRVAAGERLREMHIRRKEEEDKLMWDGEDGDWDELDDELPFN